MKVGDWVWIDGKGVKVDSDSFIAHLMIHGQCDKVAPVPIEDAFRWIVPVPEGAKIYHCVDVWYMVDGEQVYEFAEGVWNKRESMDFHPAWFRIPLNEVPVNDDSFKWLPVEVREKMESGS